MIRPRSLLLIALLGGTLLSPTLAAAELALLIDDLGNHAADSHFLALPPEVGVAILPMTPYSRRLAQTAHRQQRDILVHLPMESVDDRPLGPGGLTRTMSRTAFQQTLDQSLDAVPYARGVNNHMGSQLTQEAEPMARLMDTLKQRRWFFLDSRTTLATVAEQAARQAGIPTLRRHLFLDNQPEPPQLEQAFEQALRLARRQPVVVIAHPYPQTLAFLRLRLNEPHPGWQLVPLSSLLAGDQDHGQLASAMR